MKRLCLSLLAASSFLLAESNVRAAEQAPTVASLLKDGYAIVGILQSPAGAGIYLKKGDELIACFAAETPSSKDIATKYCKPVR
jgi:hypothetical protein